MKIRKCIQCGGNLELLRLRKMWVCPYCGAKYTDEVKESEKNLAEYYGLNEEVFEIERDLSGIMKNHGGAGCIRSIVYCMNSFETAGQIEEYMSRLPISDDISINGVREDQIRKAMPVLENVMGQDERVILLGNTGIFSKGKEYFAVTDKRSVFVNKNKLKEIFHSDLLSLQFQTCGNCCINEDYEKNFINLDRNGKFQGAILAYICMRSFEDDPERDKIRIV